MISNFRFYSFNIDELIFRFYNVKKSDHYYRSESERRLYTIIINWQIELDIGLL